MRLLYGTGNRAKLDAMRQALLPAGIEVVGPSYIGIEHLTVDETGDDPLTNARIKAWAYFRVSRMPVFACDSGLYMKGLRNVCSPECTCGTSMAGVSMTSR